MDKSTALITEEQEALIRSSPLFFVASAESDLSSGPKEVGPVNVSPKGGVPLHILGPDRVAYLDYQGSGNETARHVEAGGPITIMVCSFEEDNAAILRLYGRGHATSLDESPFAELLLGQPAKDLLLPERQAIVVDVHKVTTSCGYGVPVMSFVRERTVTERGRRYKEPR